MLKNSILIVLSLLALLPTQALAQKGSETESKWDVISSQREDFFNQRLNLTPIEAKAFWPIYEEYWSKKMEIINARKSTLAQCSQNIDKFSDAEIKRQSELYMSYQLQEYELIKEYHTKFLGVLSPARVLLIYVLDNEFKSFLLREMKRGCDKN